MCIRDRNIPTTPPGADTSYVKTYLASASGVRMTVDPTVAGNRAFVARTTYGDNNSANLKNWIDTQFGPDYVIKVYVGDPNSGGSTIDPAGAGSSTNDTWFFDYSSGVLNFNGDQIPSGVTSSNIYIVGYRYTGTKGLQQPGGLTTATSVIISGLSTFTGTVDLSNDLRVGGATTFTGNVTFNGGTIGLGDSVTDNIVFNADVDSNFIPDDDDTYDLGSATQQWRDIHIDGVAYVDDLSVDSVVGSYATITTVKATNADLNDAKITTGITTNFTVGQTVGDGSLTINAPTGINSHTDLPDNVMIRIGSDDDLTVEHVDTDGFSNRGHSQLRHSNGLSLIHI